MLPLPLFMFAACTSNSTPCSHLETTVFRPMRVSSSLVRTAVYTGSTSSMTFVRTFASAPAHEVVVTLERHDHAYRPVSM